MKKRSIIILSIVAVIVIAAFVVYSKAVAPKPNDNANAKFITIENLMGVQYTEILPV